MARNLVVLGSTGSIGRQTLDVVRSMSEHVSIYGLAAGGRLDVLASQIAEFRPTTAVTRAPCDPRDVLAPGVEVLSGQEAVCELVSRSAVDLVVVGTAGGAGLLPTLAALKAGKLVALANKETLVMAGSIIRKILDHGSGKLLPIDSEHSAIWQCLQGEYSQTVERLTLTASGGALRALSRGELEEVTPQQALQHPTWSMGPKITIDSANLMNKGLEAIEAQWLFQVPLDRVDIILHPQSIVHSLVTFSDGSTKAQLGLPDMRLPIQYALSHPQRWPNTLERLDLAAVGSLQFERIDLGRYPALALALEAGKRGGTYPAVLSAADEIAVQAFLDGLIGFTDISRVIQATLDRHVACSVPELDDILESDHWARSAARQLIIS